MKLLLISGGLMLQFSLAAQNVGIGTMNPAARLHVVDSAVVFSAAGSVPFVSGKTAIQGAGRRMMWHPDKAAFRAGYVYSGGWDDISIGHFSFAAGQEVIAKGNSSIALGQYNYAEGIGAIAIGANCNAKYNYSVAIGRDAISFAGNGIAIGTGVSVSNLFGLALGYAATSSGEKAISIGNLGTASGTQSFAIGNTPIASGSNSFAIGNVVHASGVNSVAMGSYASTSNLNGAFALGDNSTTTVMQSFAANGFRARFAGGYRLFTTSAVTIGAFLNAGANSWAALSDVRIKENFLPVDGESFLQKIAALPLTTWNYIGQEAKTMRHYGPMAQDFYAAFGRDALGEIGCDTLINQQDFLGVNLIAIQALEKRTEKIDELEKKVDQQEKKMEKLEKENAFLKEQMNAVLKAIKADQGASKD
jgi:Chaperone of endosialidase